MTEDQKANCCILEILQASKGVPRETHYIAQQMRLAGRPAEVPTLLEMLLELELVTGEKNELGVRRWSITAKGREVLDML
jgi:predicted transcriptional regulator